MNKLIVLDRDGVINYDSDQYIKSLEEFIFIPDSIKAISLLSQSGYKIAVATNQSGIFRKYYSLDTLNQMHEKLLQAVAAQDGHINKICFCPHGPDCNCECRKPKTGMLTEIFNSLDGNLNNSIMVGDSLTDLQAADTFGIQAVLVRTGKGERTIPKLGKTQFSRSIPIYDNLYQFALKLTQQ